MFKSKTFLGLPALNKISIKDIKSDPEEGAVFSKLKTSENYDILRTNDKVLRLFSKKGEILNKEVYEQVLKGETIEIEDDEFATEEDMDDTDPLDI